MCLIIIRTLSERFLSGRLAQVKLIRLGYDSGLYKFAEIGFLPRDASAERGDATVSRLSVRPSVCL